MPDQSDDLEGTRQQTAFRPYRGTGGQGCTVGFVGHTKIGPPRVPEADSFVQYTFTIRTDASGTLEFSERYSTMYARHQQLKQQKALEHYDPPLVFPGKGSVMPWWPGADKRIAERGEKLADYYQRLVCEATTETLETLGTCWAPGYTLHEVALKSSAAEPVASVRVPAVVSSNQEEESTEEGVVERQERLVASPSRESSEGVVATQGQVLVADSDTPELQQQQQQQQQQRPVAVKDSQQTKSAAWWIGLLVLLVAAVLGGIMTYPTLFLNDTSLVDALPLGGVLARGKLDKMRANLQAAEASRHADLASVDEIDAANTAEVERAHQLKAGLEMRRRQLSIAEEEKQRLQAAEKQREKQRAAYEASMVRKRAQRHTYTQHQSDVASVPVGTEAPANEAITTKHGCTCLPTTVDHSDPRAPVEWDGCASRTATIIIHTSCISCPYSVSNDCFPSHTCVSHASAACRSGEQAEQQAGVMWNQDVQVHSSLVCRCTMALMSVDDALQFHSCVQRCATQLM